MLRQCQPEHQGIFLWIAIVGRPLTDWREARAEIQRLCRAVGLADLQKDFLHPTLPEVRQRGSKQRSGDTSPPEVRRYGEVQDFSGSSDLASDQVAGDHLPGIRHQPERPGRVQRFTKAVLAPGIAEAAALESYERGRISPDCRPNPVRGVHAPSPSAPALPQGDRTPAANPVSIP